MCLFYIFSGFQSLHLISLSLLSFWSLLLFKETVSTAKICADFFSSAAFDIKFSKSFSSYEHSFCRFSFNDLVFLISNSTFSLSFSCSSILPSFFCSLIYFLLFMFLIISFLLYFVGNYDGNCRLSSQIPRAT